VTVLVARQLTGVLFAVTLLSGGACHTPPAFSAAPAPVPSSDSAKAPAVTHRFYANRPYGSEAEFNPLSLVINGGYDQLRTSDYRRIFDLPYRAEAHLVWRNVTDPEPAIRHYGVRNWLTHEVFPLTTKGQGGGQWYPNYELHLFAGGMTYARTVEWYEQHGVTSHPEIAAGLTVFTWHFLTEMVESNANCCDDVDGLTDLLIFDTGSILLWNQSWMRRPFGGRVEFTDWPGQATLSGRRIENANMMAMLRGPLPRTDDWKIMTTMGNAFLVGLSRRVGRDFWLTASGGFDPSDNSLIDTATFAKTVDLLPNAGFFIDRDGSLLVSVVAKGGSTNGTTLNVYPGVIGSGWWSPGLWLQQIRGGGWRYGIVSRVGVGLGGKSR
jgi:hypothetical protein